MRREITCLRLLITLLITWILSATQVTAQTFRVDSDSAVFVQQLGSDKLVAAVPRGRTFYAIERKSGWIKAVEPSTRTVAWISRQHLSMVDDDAASDRVRVLVQREKEFYLASDESRLTPKLLDEIHQWADEINRLHGPRHPVSATVLGTAGNLYRNAMSYDQAERFYRRSLQVFRDVYGDQSEQVAKSNLKLARLFVDTGDLVQAGKHSKTAALINAELFGDDHPSTADARIEMARALLSGSQNAAALTFLHDAHASYVKHHGVSDPTAIYINGLIAYAYREMGQIEQAIATRQSSLAALQQQTPLDGQAVLSEKVSIAALQVRPSDDDSIQRVSKLIDRFRSQFTDTASIEFVSGIERQLVTVLLQNGSRDHRLAALQLMDGAIRRLRVDLRKELWGIPAAKQADYLSYAASEKFFESISAAVDLKDDPDFARTSAEWLINAKGLITEVRAAQASGTNLQRRKAFAELPYVTLKEIQQQLSPGTVYVDILRYLDTDFGDDFMSLNQRTAHYAAWIVRDSGAPTIVDLGRALFIDDAIEATRKRIYDSEVQIQKTSESAAFQSMEKSLRRTSQRIWDPIKAAMGDADKIILSPDQGMWLLPWAALMNSDGSFLVETHQIRMELSGRDLIRDLPASNQPAVVFADPDYGDENEAPIKSGQIRIGFASALPGTADEAKVVTPLVERLTGQKARVLTGTQASESAFKSLRGPSIVTLSTHGFFLNSIGQVTLAARIQSDHSAAIDHSQTIAAKPLLSCGLMLADANGHVSIDSMQNDGVLTGAEIAAVNLKGTRLAVLSACETGVGSLDATGGTLGLRSAFHEAGTQCVVGSLWLVPDRATAQLMKSFYENLANHQTVEASLQAAQRTAIKQRRDKNGAAHPFFWAAFNVSGHTTFGQ